MCLSFYFVSIFGQKLARNHHNSKKLTRLTVLMVVAGVELGLAGESVDEGCVGEEAVLVLGVAQLSQQLLDVLLGDLVTHVGQQVLQLSQHHGAVVVLVVQLQQLDEVVVVAGGVGGLGGLLHLADDVVELGELLALLVDLAKADTHLHR